MSNLDLFKGRAILLGRPPGTPRCSPAAGGSTSTSPTACTSAPTWSPEPGGTGRPCCCAPWSRSREPRGCDATAGSAVPPIPGVGAEHVFTLWTIPNMDRIHKFIEEKRPRTAVVAGVGFIGLEMAEALHARGISVKVAELAPQVMISMDAEFAAMIKAGLEENGVAVRTNVGLSEVRNGSVMLSEAGT